jgi:GntR family transcriptional regulator/MocR family aminotransferase
VQLFGEDAGMHILWKLPDGFSADAVAAAAATRDVGLYTFDSVGAREFEGSNLARDSLVLGYSSLSADEVTEGIRRVAAAMEVKGKTAPHHVDVSTRHASMMRANGAR